MSSEKDTLLVEDKERDEIRTELSQMSFEDLQRLKEQVGTKVYNATVFGARKSKRNDFKRENRNRPQEMSAKRPKKRFKEVIQVKKSIPRDPRFDSLCGTFNKKVFNRSYDFIDKIKENDLNVLKEELKETEDPKKVKKIKYLIQRLENQLREKSKQKEREEKEQKERQAIIESIKQGEKPAFKKKSEKKILDLVSQYENLKNSGKLKKHIQRLRKKNMHKDRVKLATAEIE